MLIIGLGNIGKQYVWTHHNLGFEFVNCIREMYSNEFSVWEKHDNYELSMGTIFGKVVQLCKPQTNMNLSGRAVVKVLDQHKTRNQDIIIVYDDIYTKLYDIKFSTHKDYYDEFTWLFVDSVHEGGARGHNGLKNINLLIGNRYNKIRIGIGEPTHDIDLKDYVLMKVKNPTKWKQVFYAYIRQFNK